MATENKLPIPSRITVVDNLYFQETGEQTSQFSCQFSRNVESEQQPYERRLKATEEWQPIDTGWLDEDVGALFIRNEAGKNLQTIPTEAEALEISKQVLQLSFGGTEFAAWNVPPGESFRGSPATIKDLMIRSLSGTPRYTLYLIPR